MRNQFIIPEQKQQITELEQVIAKLEEKIHQMDISDTQLFLFENQLNTKEAEMEKIFEFRTKGAILRSRTKWYNEGEKNTKYFLNLEKRHFKQGTISQIKTNDNETVTSDKQILI